MTAILYPTIALVALVFLVWFSLILARFRHMQATPPTADSFSTGSAARSYFEPVELPANNLANLFEMPVLYFTLIPLLLVTAQAGRIQIMLAWAYVALRVVHSILHVAGGRVIPRFFVYLVSCIVLSAMWIGFAVDLAKMAPMAA